MLDNLAHRTDFRPKPQRRGAAEARTLPDIGAHRERDPHVSADPACARIAIARPELNQPVERATSANSMRISEFPLVRGGGTLREP